MAKPAKSISFIKLLLDLILLTVSFTVSAVWAQSFDILLDRQYMFLLLILQALTWLLTNRYKPISFEKLTYSLFSRISNILRNTAIQVVLAVFFIFIIKENLFTRNFIIYNGVLTFVLFSGEQWLISIVIRKFRLKQKFRINAVIVGETELGKSFKLNIIDKPQYGYNFLGFIDDDSPASIGAINELEKIIAKLKVEEIIIALSLKEIDKLRYILRVSDKLAVKAFIIPDYFKLLSNKFRVDLLGDFPVLAVRDNPLEELQSRAVKRFFDLFLSLLAFVLILWWLIPVIALIIKLSSPGPVFFIQKRVGKNNELFDCIKFRTMTLQASSNRNANIPVTPEDRRVTKIGKILRKSNLDEIPQFVNVFLGQMSIVGPRPHAVPFDNDYGEIVEEIKLRHRVKPGITGWAQIHGLRGDVFDFEEQSARTKKRIAHDIWYIENWSFKLDLLIISKTIYQTLTGRNKGN